MAKRRASDACESPPVAKRPCRGDARLVFLPAGPLGLCPARNAQVSRIAFHGASTPWASHIVTALKALAMKASPQRVLALDATLRWAYSVANGIPRFRVAGGCSRRDRQELQGFVLPEIKMLCERDLGSWQALDAGANTHDWLMGQLVCRWVLMCQCVEEDGSDDAQPLLLLD